MGNVIPSFYSHWLKANSFEAETPNEEGAFNCGSCFMLKPKGLTRDLGPFRSHLKCCTYSPFLPSYSIGALLVSETPSLAGFLKGSKLTPWGAVPRVRQGTSICETGRHDTDVCSFLSVKGDCTIHSHRPAVCASYVCRSHDGADGLRQWREFESRLATWENTLATLVALEAGFTLDDQSYEFESLDEALTFYRRAYKLALEISPDDIGNLDG